MTEFLSEAVARREARKIIAARFRAVGIDDPEREAQVLITAAAALRSLDLIAEPEAPLGAAAARVEAFASRREGGEPLSRIVGRRDFWSLTFAVTPDVLDPRADTETLVEAVLAEFAERRAEPLRIVDFGVGAGPILAALLSEFPNAIGIGVEKSPAAAATAAANFSSLGLSARAELRIGNWGEGLAGPFDLVVSNPPYIPSAEIATLSLEVREHDPRLALDGGPDGLSAYRALAPEITRLIAPGGRFALEHGLGQGPELRGILEFAGLRVISTRADLGGIVRVVVGAAAGDK